MEISAIKVSSETIVIVCNFLQLSLIILLLSYSLLFTFSPLCECLLISRQHIFVSSKLLRLSNLLLLLIYKNCSAFRKRQPSFMNFFNLNYSLLPTMKPNRNNDFTQRIVLCIVTVVLSGLLFIKITGRQNIFSYQGIHSDTPGLRTYFSGITTINSWLK